jgi:DNA polymerase-1
MQLRNFAERTALNSPLQGTAADLIKLAMISIDERIREKKLAARMILQVHDELLFEAPMKEKEVLEKLVQREMEGVHKLIVPLVVEMGTGPNWRDLD